MSLVSQIAAIYNAFVGSQNIRMTGLQPAVGLNGANVTAGKAAYGAWATIVATATITNPSWLCGVGIGLITADTEFGVDIQVGQGVACAEVGLANVYVFQKVVTAAGAINLPAQFLPFPVQISGANTRIAGRGGWSDACNTNVVQTKVILATAVGS